VAYLLVSLKEKVKCMGLHGLTHAPDLSFFGSRSGLTCYLSLIVFKKIMTNDASSIITNNESPIVANNLLSNFPFFFTIERMIRKLG
jgi:hypothetical protein